MDKKNNFPQISENLEKNMRKISSLTNKDRGSYWIDPETLEIEYRFQTKEESPNDVLAFNTLGETLEKLDELRRVKMDMLQKEVLAVPDDKKKRKLLKKLDNLAQKEAEYNYDTGEYSPGVWTSEGKRSFSQHSEYKKFNDYLIKPEIDKNNNYQFRETQEEHHQRLFEETFSELLEHLSSARKLIRKTIKQDYFLYYPKELQKDILNFINISDYVNFADKIDSAEKNKFLNVNHFINQLGRIVGIGSRLVTELLEKEDFAKAEMAREKKDIALALDGAILRNFEATYPTKYVENSGLYVINPDGTKKKADYVSTGNSSTTERFNRIEKELAIGLRISKTNDKEFPQGSGIIWQPEIITPEQIKTVQEIENQASLGTKLQEALGLEVKEKKLDAETIKRNEEKAEMTQAGLLEVWQKVNNVYLAYQVKKELPILIKRFGESKLLQALNNADKEPRLTWKREAFRRSLDLTNEQMEQEANKDSSELYMLSAKSPTVRQFAEYCDASFALLKKQLREKK